MDNQLSTTQVIERLKAMKSNIDLEEFDTTRATDKLYCVEFCIKVGRWKADNVIGKYITELETAAAEPPHDEFGVIATTGRGEDSGVCDNCKYYNTPVQESIACDGCGDRLPVDGYYLP